MIGAWKSFTCRNCIMKIDEILMNELIEFIAVQTHSTKHHTCEIRDFRSPVPDNRGSEYVDFPAGLIAILCLWSANCGQRHKAMIGARVIHRSKYPTTYILVLLIRAFPNYTQLRVNSIAVIFDEPRPKSLTSFRGILSAAHQRVILSPSCSVGNVSKTHLQQVFCSLTWHELHRGAWWDNTTPDNRVWSRTSQYLSILKQARRLKVLFKHL